jgi:hypothetical protein
MATTAAKTKKRTVGVLGNPSAYGHWWIAHGVYIQAGLATGREWPADWQQIWARHPVGYPLVLPRN